MIILVMSPSLSALCMTRRCLCMSAATTVTYPLTPISMLHSLVSISQTCVRHLQQVGGLTPLMMSIMMRN